MLSLNSPYKSRWDLFVIVFASYNCFQIPIEVAFDPPFFKLPLVVALAYMIDFAFFIDILVSFRTTYINELNGQEVVNPRMISIYYLKGQFIIDFLATVPFDTFASLLLGEAGFFKVLGALKLVRVLRLNRMIVYLRTSMEIKATLQVFKLIFFLLIYEHCFCCVWWLLVKDDPVWIPPFWWNQRLNFFYVYTEGLTY